MSTHILVRFTIFLTRVVEAGPTVSGGLASRHGISRFALLEVPRPTRSAMRLIDGVVSVRRRANGASCQPKRRSSSRRICSGGQSA